MSKSINMSKTSYQFESSQQNYQSQNNQGKIEEGFQQMEGYFHSEGGKIQTQQHQSSGGEIKQKFINSSKNDHETIQFGSSQEQNSQSALINGKISSMKQQHVNEDHGWSDGGMQVQSKFESNPQTSSSTQQTSYQTQTIVTKTITTSSHQISKSNDQEQFENAGFELMSGQGNLEGEANGIVSESLYKYGGYNLKADHAQLGGELKLNKYNFSDASLKDKQFKSSAGKIQMACDVAMAAALRKQEEQASTGGAIANWELQMNSMAELKAQYQISAKVAISQRSHLLYGYGFHGKDGKPQQCEEGDQEKKKEPLNMAVCDAECIEKPKNKLEELASAPQDPEEFTKSKYVPIIQSPDTYFKPRSEDFIRIIPKSQQQIVYPVNSVRSIIKPQFVTCEQVQVAKQSIRTKCSSVRQPVIIQEETAPTILQRTYGAPNSVRHQESFFTVQSVQQQLVAVQPQVIQQQAIIQVQPQPIIQQQVVQVQEIQPLQQVIMVQPTQNAETYSQQHIQIQQPHLIGQTVQLIGQQTQFVNTQAVQMTTQQHQLVVAQPQQVVSVAQQGVLRQGIQQEIIPQVAVQQQQIVSHTQLIQQDATSPIRQTQIIQQPQVVLQPSSQQQIMLVSTQPLVQQQTAQIQQSVYQIQPQQTIQQIQSFQQVTSPLRQQHLVLQSQIPQSYTTQPIEILQPSQSLNTIPISQQQFGFQYILQKV
ncbi:unnamed protein product (macronuclear) [Paramecium tetraurelia]|uniref:Uncharacterized protein n=1 Tax=Paramecium tetraurelia TaxID=5888 RepID=A0DQV6_PARTE|nr:uncharacterized protein GSPATT00002823001 [Paramecium tetraurelia]CAK85423.1 unnamed protein product [Paramecium tetraurelia]|eukprot:XP_001452820.1 hypothetical protein (macronuclear) [Paramecium tetraurelia strain d4-2]